MRFRPALLSFLVFAVFVYCILQYAYPVRADIFSLPPTGVTPGTYGDSSHVGQFQVDATGRLLAASNVAIAGVSPPVRSIGATFDGGGSALTGGTGSTVYYTVPYACTIQAWNVTVDTGTITFDVWKIASGTAIPTAANSIVAAAAPAISTGTAVHSTTLTGWTTSVVANDIFGVEISAVSGATKASLVMECQ